MKSVPELRFLQRLALAAASTLDEAELVRLVIAETTEACATDVCSIYLMQPQEARLVLAATNGLSQAGVGRVSLAVGEGITGHAAAERRPLVVPDVRDEPRFRWLHGVDQARFVSMCSVPIVSGGRLVGVLNVQTDEPRDFNAEEVELLTAIAAQVAGVLERSELQRRLSAQFDELRRSDEIQRRFGELALSGTGLAAICRGIAHYAGAEAVVYDEDGEVLGSSAAVADRRRLANPAPRGDDPTVVAVQAGPDLLGWLSVARGPDDGSSCRDHAIEHGRTALALELMRERAAAEAERRLRGDLLGELLARPHSPTAAAELIRRSARLGLRIRGPAWVVLIDPDDANALRGLESLSTHRRVTRALADFLRNQGGLPVELAGGFALILPGQSSLPEIERLARSAREIAMRRAGGVSLSAGIGSGPGAPEDLHRLAGEARHALAVARRAGQRETVATHASLGVERLLVAIGDHDMLTAYVDEFLGPLAEHQDSGRASAPLVETLEALVAEGWNLRATARRLIVHVNTLLYRVRRIEEISGRKLDDADQRLAFAMALRARALLTTDSRRQVPPLDVRDHSLGRGPRTGRAGMVGARVGITAGRRAHEQAALVTALGGVPVLGAALQADEPSSDERVARDLADALAGPVDIAVFLTGAGASLALEAADGAGVGDDLRAALRSARVIARGPKPRRALRAAGVRIDWMADPPRMTVIRDALLAAGVAGRRIMVQGFGPPPEDLVDPLTEAGAEMVVLSPYAAGWPSDPAGAMDIAREVRDGTIDAITFTSARAARQFVALADECGVDATTIRDSGVLVAAVGPVTRAALNDAGVTVHVEPERARMGAMYRALAGALGTPALGAVHQEPDDKLQMPAPYPVPAPAS